MMINKKMLLLLSGSLFLSACTLGSPPTSEIKKPEEVKDQSLSSSVRELMAMGKSLQCNYQFTDPQTKVETKGVMYLSGTKFAQESEVTAPKESSVVSGKMNMISDGTNMYTWNPDKKDGGMKFTIDQETKDKAQANNNNVDLDKKIDMKCNPWVASESKFIVPTDIKFTDLSELMKGVQDQLKKLPSGVTLPKNMPTLPAD